MKFELQIVKLFFKIVKKLRKLGIGRFTIDANSLAPPGGDLHETQHPSGLLYFSYAFVVEDSAGEYITADCKINVQFRIASTTEVPNDPTVATTTNDTLKKNCIKS